MYLTRSEYDRGVNTFSPEGRLFQVRLCSTGSLMMSQEKAFPPRSDVACGWQEMTHSTR